VYIRVCPALFLGCCHAAGGNKSAPSCAFWGFTVTANLLPTIASVLHKSKLVLVFDIDETLLLAHTLDSLQQKLQKIKVER
jgi:hypothetical protein